MNIINSDSYYNSIYQAIVVNADNNQDPENKYRIQIYIPLLQPEYINLYQNYINSANKSSHKDKNKFPWAISLVGDLTEGNIVYGGFINNDINQYIILGLDAYNPVNQKSESNGYLTNGQDLLNMTMPIILHNEIGIGINDWPDNISNDAFIKINPYDNGGWSIGLIQWHHARAYDCCFEIAKNDGDWENKFTDKSCQLYLDLKSSIQKGRDTEERNKYSTNFHPTPGTSLYQSIQNLLGSDKGKQTQKQYASSDTQTNIANLQGDPYNIQNPAIIIFLADIMNQYGSGVTQTKQNASRIARSNKSIMEQFEEFVTYCKNNLGSYNTYKNRRDSTYSYIIELDKQGKFNASNLTDLGATGGGQYCLPFKGSAVITATFGNTGYRKPPSYHSGVDFALSLGTPLYACTDGIIDTMGGNGTTGYSRGYGIASMIKASDGNEIIYGHFQRRDNNALNGASVKKGQIIGYCDSTGKSTGNHLHFEIRVKGQAVNPFPYLGMHDDVNNYYDKTVGG